MKLTPRSSIFWVSMPEHQYLPFLKKVLTSHRLEHSLGVMSVMGEIAPIYGQNREMSEIIGILHDAAKDLPQKAWQQLVIEGGIQQQFECEQDYNMYLHGPVGAYFVQKELGITDPLILEAISTHTSYGNSRYYNHPICWCLRFADILEPN